MKQSEKSVCRLCQQPRKLSRSHIIPEFMYKPLYGEDHRLLGISTDRSIAVDRRQSGHWEWLLCAECEAKISRWERYAKTIVFGGRSQVTVVQNTEEHMMAENIDYHKFKLFQLSVLWRAGVSNLSFFEAVDIPDHLEHLRRMLLCNQPGTAEEYGCMMMSVAIGEMNFDTITQPTLVAHARHKWIRFVFGGFIWMFIISSGPTDLSEKALFLQEDGSLAMPKSDFEDLAFLKRDIGKLHQRENDVLRAYLGRRGRRQK